MANIVVSAHGGRWSKQQPDLEIPGGSEVDFYVKDGEILSTKLGYEILGNLEKGQEPGGKVAQVIWEGGKTYDYSCWYAKEFGAACGIFQVGSSKPIQDLSAYTPDKPLLLSAILKQYPNCKVYWDCCREVSTAEEGFRQESSPDAFPGPPPS